jgi:uncharacterized protein YjbI with pentapeptide repeats
VGYAVINPVKAVPNLIEVLERLMAMDTEDRRCGVIAAKADLGKCDMTGATLTGARLLDETIFCRTGMRDGSVDNAGC